jgi:C4-dicarboxylate-binding protein DctP
MKLMLKAVLIGLPLVLAWTAQAQVKVKIATPTVNDMAQEWYKVFAAGVEKRAPGKIKVEFYPSNQLGSLPATVEGTALGTIEMISVASGFLVGLEPRFLVLDMPGLFDNTEHGRKVFSDPAARAVLSQFGKGKDLEPIAYFVHSPLYLLSHKPVRKVADLAGQKLRMPGGAPLHLEPYRKVGASPLSMPLGEVLPAMQNKTIDGAISGLTVYTGFKYYDVAKAMTALPGSVIIAPIVANSGFLKSLGPDLEKVVREEAMNAENAIVPWGVADEAAALEVWRKNGGEVITLPADEQKKYIDNVVSILPIVYAANPNFKADYEVLLAAAQRARSK